MKKHITAEQIIAVMKRKGFKVFTGGEYNLNIVGIRAEDPVSNKFDDQIVVFYEHDGEMLSFKFPATTDPGTYYRENPINVKGTAILKPGQYRGAYKLGKHKGYRALVQRKPVTVYRDDNKDDVLDTEGMVEDTGFHGINIHRAHGLRPGILVNKWSAGCQVLQGPMHFSFLIAMCEKAAELYSNSFTYTLLEETDF